MKNIIGTKVIHEEFGVGIITAINDNIIMTVSFDGIEKRYRYPDAFCKSIQSEDIIIQEEAEGAWLAELEKKKAEEEAKKTAGKVKKQVRKILSPEEIEQKKKELEKILAEIDNNAEFTEHTNRIFIVHQGKTYGEEFRGEYVWAPVSGIHHHEKMNEIHKGDILVNYANGAVQAVSEAISDWFYSPRPTELSGYGWEYTGFRVQLRYQSLSEPIKLDSIQSKIITLRAPMYSSFDSSGNACQGYMYELEISIAKLIKALILTKSQPAGVVSVLARF